jgi:hypothetical protein
MSRLKLLILDANVVIKLFELGCWARVAEECDIHLSRTVVEQEAQFFRDAASDERVEIDLSGDIAADRIHVFDVGLAELQSFRSQFNVVYLEKLDPGESESLAYLVTSRQDHRICSADSIVYRVLGRFQRGDQGISLEEVLQKIGWQKRLPDHYSRQFREHWTNEGAKEMIWGTGLNPTE